MELCCPSLAADASCEAGARSRASSLTSALLQELLCALLLSPIWRYLARLLIPDRRTGKANTRVNLPRQQSLE